MIKLVIFTAAFLHEEVWHILFLILCSVGYIHLVRRLFSEEKP